jgi:molybdopterin converting factor small subunit
MAEKNMKIHVKFHTRFKTVFGAPEKEIELKKGANVRDLPGVLCTNEEQSKSIYAEKEKRLRQDVAVTKNRRFIFHMKRLDTELEDRDEVSILYPACMG